jgi:Asp-tRNA(Asn)/Glu-tRNA(Gln) amidotransferase A subunit family amidase
MGPMGRSVEDLALIVKILTDEGNYTKTSMDPYFKITPFNIKMYRSLPPKMRIGYFDNIDIMPATSGI